MRGLAIEGTSIRVKVRLSYSSSRRLLLAQIMLENQNSSVHDLLKEMNCGYRLMMSSVLSCSISSPSQIQLLQMPDHSHPGSTISLQGWKHHLRSHWYSSCCLLRSLSGNMIGNKHIRCTATEYLFWLLLLSCPSKDTHESLEREMMIANIILTIRNSIRHPAIISVRATSVHRIISN